MGALRGILGVEITVWLIWRMLSVSRPAAPERNIMNKHRGLGFGFRVEGLGFMVYGLGLRV